MPDAGSEGIGSQSARIGAETVVEPVPPRWRWQVITPGQWRVLRLMGERTRVRDLAAAGGVGLGEASATVAELARAGLCVVRAPEPAPPDRAPGDVDPDGARHGVAADATGGPAAPLPRRDPGRALPAGVARRGEDSAPRDGDDESPDEQVLRRLLGSLQQMG